MPTVWSIIVHRMTHTLSTNVRHWARSASAPTETTSASARKRWTSGSANTMPTAANTASTAAPSLRQKKNASRTRVYLPAP